MKYKIIIPILFLALLLGMFWVSKYLRYLDFVNLYTSENFTEILENQTLQSPEMLHNYGLTALEQFKKDGMQNIDNLIESNKLFSWSLQKQEHEKTRFQYEFTKALLDLFKQQQKQQEQNQDQQSQETDQWDTGEAWDESQQWEWWEDENSTSQSQNGRESQYYLNQWEEIKPLSEWEQKKLDQSIEKLKSDQMNNQQYYGKQQQLTPFQEAFDSVFWTVDRWGEKDW